MEALTQAAELPGCGCAISHYTDMQHEIDTARLAAAVRDKRGKTGVRKTADEIGDVSSSTLSRIEQGRLPDIDTYMRLCRWMDVTPTYFALDSVAGVEDKPGPPVPLPQQFLHHLKADRTLPDDTRRAIVTLIEMAYAAAEDGTLPNESEP